MSPRQRLCARDLLLSLSALWWLGCAGTIDDPSRFELGSLGAGAEPASSTLDAGPHDAAWAPADSGWRAAPIAEDASATAPAPWPVDAGDAGTWMADAGARDAGAAAPPDAATDAGTSCFKALIMNKCGNATCHGGTSSGAGLDLTSDGLAQRVAGRRGTDACSSYLLIDTAVPEQSALYLKVTDHACGVRMPLGGTLTKDEQQCILSWIDKL
jgi:hypothetical protein